MAKKLLKRSLTVDVTLHSQPGGETPPVRVYLFDREGRLVVSKPVTGHALELQLANDERHRLLVGPDLGAAERAGGQLAAELADAEAISRDVVPGASAETVKLEIPPTIYRCWWRTCILVHGVVRKQTAPGVYVPICAGVVKIFEVDLRCTFDRLPFYTDVSQLYALLIDAMSGVERDELAARARAIPNLPELPRVAPAASASAPSPERGARTAAELAASLRGLSDAEIASALLVNKVIVAPFLCWLIPDLWFCWREIDEAAETTIQSDGSFSAQLCFWCPGDLPDLYFEVTQTIGGVEREIYGPPIACSTYYDYDGAEEIVITVEDPAAVACNSPAAPPIEGIGHYVWPTAIGNFDLRGVTGLEQAPGSPSQGLAGTSPWGGTLALQVQFDPRLKSETVAKHYRWSYKFDGDASYAQINAPVNHRYMTVTSWAPLEIELHTVNLGPNAVGSEQNLFEIPDPYPGDGWVDIDDPYDRPFAYFDSTGNHYSPFGYTDAAPRRSGMCTLLLEIFDAAGNLVKCANNGLGGPFDFVLPDLSGAPTQFTSQLLDNNITPDGQLTFRVLIDNNDTLAQINSVSVAGKSADKCGTLKYTNGDEPVEIAFEATQPEEHLWWELGVTLGFYGSVAAESGSSSSPPAPKNPLVSTAGALLQGCGSGAFAVNLRTWATATDGYSRQSQYDRVATAAFALLT